MTDLKVVHSPVSEDCTLCHEFSKTDSGTQVELTFDEPELCLQCHGELEAAVALELEAPHPALEGSCLDCHEVHGSNEAHLLTASITETCGGCHDVEDLAEQHGGQLTEATDCASCHQPHGSNYPKMLVAANQHAPFAEGSCSACHRNPIGNRIRLRARGNRLCTACHGEFPTPESGGSVHGVLADNQRTPSCTQCHDPHMSDQARFLDAAGPELCSECHEGVVTAATSDLGHMAAEDCSNCHVPHTSAEAHLLVENEDSICGMCHDLEDESLIASHLGANLGSLSCLSCHSPHGDGQPNLLWANLHPPIEDGCDTCHEGAFDQLVEGGGAELCLMCHDDIGEVAASAEYPHVAMEVDGCTSCHNPHASAQRKLVKLPGGQACADCHDNKLPAADEVAHGIITLIGCEACHEPHGGERPSLLRQSAGTLCLACHGPSPSGIEIEGDAAKFLGRFEVSAVEASSTPKLRLEADGVTGHPVDQHLVLGVPTAKEVKRSGSTFEDELTCLTCHDPHKGRTTELFRWGATSAMEVCQQCHTK